MHTTVRIKTLPHYEGLPLPAYGTALAACVDLLAAIDAPITVNPGEFYTFPTGVCTALPEGHALLITCRSGLARKNGFSVVHGVGTIDADYRGEIQVPLINQGKEPFTIERGMRIAQGMLTKYERMIWEEVTELEATERGEGGFGSTGLK
jgi:dUTP pyrophosphatase